MTNTTRTRYPATTTAASTHPCTATTVTIITHRRSDSRAVNPQDAVMAKTSRTLQAHTTTTLIRSDTLTPRTTRSQPAGVTETGGSFTTSEINLQQRLFGPVSTEEFRGNEQALLQTKVHEVEVELVRLRSLDPKEFEQKYAYVMEAAMMRLNRRQRILFRRLVMHRVSAQMQLISGTTGQ